MELIINKCTYTLRPVNAERRGLFVDKVLSIYDYRANDFKSFLESTQKILKEKHNLNMSLDKVKSNFFKHYTSGLHNSIWSFLSSEDKKTLKIIDNLDIEKEELQKFIEYVCNKIKQYSTYVKSNHNNTVSEDIYSIYSYLSRVYGWTYDEIKEMDELEVLKAIENAIDINEKEQVTDLNTQALAGAYISGSKQAKSKIDSINRKVNNKSKYKQAERSGELKEDSITRDQIKNIIEDRNAGR